MSLDASTVAQIAGQAGALGAVVMMVVEAVRKRFNVRQVKWLVMLASFAVVHLSKANMLGDLGLEAGSLATVLNALLVSGAARVTHDGMDIVEKVSDR